VTFDDDRVLLGLDRDFVLSDVHEARRRLSLVHHPDRGGDVRLMSAINAAADRLSNLDPNHISSPYAEDSRPTSSGESRHDVDRPSFVVEALPVVAHEVLLIAASTIGEVLDDDPPYLIEFAIAHGDGERSWCRAELVPDAGASTVSLIVDGRADAERVRDLLVQEINQLGVDH
jgi:curved DNA-binding protein CbpA